LTYSLEEIADRLEIYDLYARYVFAVDELDLAVLDRIFMPDTVFDYSTLSYGKHTYKDVQRDDFVKVAAFVTYTMHYCTNVRIDFDEDRRSARVVSKTFFANGVSEDGDLSLRQVHGHYADALVKTREGWRIKERTWHLGWSTTGLELFEGTSLPEKK